MSSATAPRFLFARSARRLAAAAMLLATPVVLGQAPGSLDLNFNGTGTAIIAMSPANGDDRARGMALQPDGKIVVGGTCANDFCLARLLPDGTLDPSFGSGGRAIHNLVGTDVAYAMAMQPDGKFVLAGNCLPTNSLTATMCAARFTTAGALDPSFGGGGTGWVQVNVTSGGDSARGIAIDGSGRIVLAGVCFGFGSSTLEDFCLVRLNADGTVDTGFGSGGQVISTFGGSGLNQGANAVTIQPDGKIVVAGYCRAGSLDRFCVARYLANGTALDGTFGGGIGYVTTQVIASMDGRAYGIALQPNGKIQVGGVCGSSICLVRYLDNGALDTAFGDNGVFGTGGTTTFVARTAALALAADGTAHLGGFWNPVGGIDGTRIYRASVFGTPPGDGAYTPSPLSFYINGEAQGWAALAFQPDGKLVAAMSVPDASNFTVGNFGVARFNGFVPEARTCSLDIDGDGRVLATTDALLQARIALGMTGAAVTNGITFAPNALRQTWAEIRTYLVTQCAMTLG